MKTSPRYRKAAGVAADDAALRDLSHAIEQRLGPIEYRGLRDVIPYAGNPRQHPEHQIVQLMASIRQFGFTMPLLVAEAGELMNRAGFVGGSNS